MPNNDTFTGDSLDLPEADEPLYLEVAITGAVYEASTSILCGPKHPAPKANAFRHKVGTARELDDQDLIVVTRIVDLDKDGDTVKYRFTVSCGDKVYEYTKTKTFAATPAKGQSVKYTTVLSLYAP